MAIVEVQTRGKVQKQKIEDESIITIMDLKKKINNEDPESVLLSFKGKILTDATPISTLGDNLLFILEKDIEFTQMTQKEKSYKASVEGKCVNLKKEDIYTKNGKKYMIVNRRRKLKAKDVIDFFKKNLTTWHIMQAVLITLFVSLGNYPLIYLIFMINALKFASLFFLKTRFWELSQSRLFYLVFMFFASLVAIDHGKFLRKEKLNIA